MTNCFWAPDRLLVLAYGVRKKSNRHKRKDVDRAITMRDEYMKTARGDS